MKAISAAGLFKDYPRVRALSNLGLHVEEGEIFGFLGPNGAGKTTFVKIILGLVFPTAGDVSVFGLPVGGKKMRRKIGYLPENMRLHGFLKGHEFLDLAGRLYGLSSSERKEGIDKYLDVMGLAEAADRPLREYSKGMLQRIGIAQALIHNPELLLLDEPTSGLDPIGTKEVRDIILEEKKKGKTVFINSHLLSEIERTCNRVAILNKGKLVKTGTLGELSENVPTILVEVEEGSQKLLKGLEKVSKSVRVDGNKYHLTPKDKNTKAAIPEIIVKAEARLVTISEERESLEDIFYRVVKQEGGN
ncbi:MAG: ABC transporter ATP-binding protein [Deltaproteobacteria bacterium]|uniref:ABC transporter ATP-binding protein n=1 Tax=Candidatus Zymogenus saltonus TaxID=2844893 RepID=A0A9D8PMX4_9DELT|nr:ABC transporter ATP-binding protein [Candidatus Zymogenus saltonus]